MVAARPLARLVASPVYLSLVAACVLVGFRDAMAEPYLVLYLAERVHLPPFTLGVFLTLRAVGAVVFSMGFGLWLDRAPSLLPLGLALLAGIVGYVLLATVSHPALLLLTAAGPLAASSAAFPQLFALGKRHLDRDDPAGTERGIALMRASFSAAWGIGPVIGALIVGRLDFAGVFGANAAFGLIAIVTLLLSGLKAPAGGIGAGRAGGGALPLGLAVTAAGFTLFFMALSMSSVALPIVVVRQLGGTTGDVGVIMSACAILEVPVMMAVAARPGTLGGARALVAGFLAMVLYCLALAFAGSVGGVEVAQVLRAVAIGFVTCVGIGYMQDLMPGRAGAAAALFTITGQIGALLSGLAAGSWAEVFGFHSLFLACAVTCGAGLLLFRLGARPPQPMTVAAMPAP